MLLIFQKNDSSFLELLIMFEPSAGHGLTCEKVLRSHFRVRRPLVGTSNLSRVSVHSCLLRSVGHLPGGLARFVPCQRGAHYRWVIHLGCGHCGHGLSRRPRESSAMQIVHAFLLCSLMGVQQSLVMAHESSIFILLHVPSGFPLGQ